MSTIGLTYEQQSIVDAVLNLINSMDDKMQSVLLKKLNSKEVKTKTANGEKQKWMDYPISQEVMDMTFKHRKPIGENYKKTLEEELKKKYL